MFFITSFTVHFNENMRCSQGETTNVNCAYENNVNPYVSICVEFMDIQQTTTAINLPLASSILSAGRLDTPLIELILGIIAIFH